MRLCSNKWSKWILANLKVSKIDRLANFTLKKVLVQADFISLVIFTNYFSNPPQKRYQKNNEKLKIGLEIELAISQKNVVWDFFLESDIELRKNYSLGNFQLLLKCLPDFTWNDPLENWAFLKSLQKKSSEDHTDFIFGIESSQCVETMFKIWKILKIHYLRYRPMSESRFWKKN